MSGQGYRDTSSNRYRRRGKGIILSAVVAGPLVTSEILLFALADSLTKGEPIGTPAELWWVPFVLVVSVGFGFVPGFIAAGLGTALMLTLERYWAFARSRVAWIAAGMVLPAPFIFLQGDSQLTSPGPFVFALAFSLPGAICAWLCWRLERPSPED